MLRYADLSTLYLPTKAPNHTKTKELYTRVYAEIHRAYNIHKSYLNAFADAYHLVQEDTVRSTHDAATVITGPESRQTDTDDERQCSETSSETHDRRRRHKRRRDYSSESEDKRHTKDKKEKEHHGKRHR